MDIPILTFARGEVSDRFRGRSDTQAYSQSCRSLRNGIVGRFGNAMRRYGTKIVGPCYVNGKNVPFTIRGVGRFLLHFGENMCQVWNATTRVIESTFQAPYTTGDASLIQYAASPSILFLVHGNHAIRKFTRSSLGVWTVTVVAGPQVGSADREKTIRVTVNATATQLTMDGDYFLASDLNSLFRIGNGWVKIGDVAPTSARVATCTPLGVAPAPGTYKNWYGPYVPDAAISPGQVIYKDSLLPDIPGNIFSAHAELALDEGFNGNVANINANADERLAYFYAARPPATSTSSAACQYLHGVLLPPGGPSGFSSNGVLWYRPMERVGDNIFIQWNQNENGESILYANADLFVASDAMTPTAPGTIVIVNGGIFEVSFFYNARMVRVVTKSPTTNRFAASDWSKSATTATGFPTAVAMHQNRLVVGGIDSKPATFFTSEVGDYENFAIGVNDPDPFEATLADGTSGEIKWMQSGGDLLIGTSTGEWAIKGVPLTPTNVGSDIQSGYGSAAVQAARVGTNIFFVGVNRGSIREMVFSDEQKKYLAPDLLELADHLVATWGIKEVCYSQNLPEQVLLAILTDGSVLGFSYRRESDIAAWSPWNMTAYSAAVLPKADGNDEIWIATSRGMQVLSFENYLLDSQIDAVPSSFTVRGFDVLAGMYVTVVADGIDIGSFLVAPNGTIDISSSGISLPSSITAGVDFSFTLAPLPPEFVMQGSGATPGTLRSISDAKVLLRASRNGRIQGDGSSDAWFLGESDKNTVFSGWHVATDIGSNGRDASFEIWQSGPFHFEVLAISPDVKVGEA